MGIFEGDWPETPWEYEAAVEMGIIPEPLPPKPKPDMYVFIDDSGDSGFKFQENSSTHVVLAACLFRDPMHIEELKALTETCADHNRHRREFKYNKTKDRIKDCYYSCTSESKFDVRAIHADKRLIYSSKLREGKTLKSYLIRMLLTRNYGTISNARIVIDGHDTQGFDIPDEEYLLRMVNRETPGTIHSVRFKDSKRDRGLQAADMTAGAIGRSLQEGKSLRRKSDKHLKVIRSRTYFPQGTLWNFTGA